MPRPFQAPYPWVPAPEAELLGEARPTWERLLDDLAGARREVLFENYLWREGRAAEAVLGTLETAAAQGARVRVLLDAAGAWAASPRTRRRLGALGEFRWYHPMDLTGLFARVRERLLVRTHRRIFVVDGRTAWTGGLAVHDDWWWEHPLPHRELMVRLEGPVVAQFTDAFERLWRDAEPPPPRPLGLPRPPATRTVPHDRRRRHYLRSLLHALHACRERAWFVTPYFAPPRRLLAAMKRARRRGVEVRLLLAGPRRHDHPSVWRAGRRHYGDLLGEGIRIWEYQRGFEHAKAALFDDDAFVGSPNLDRLSFDSNHEIAAEVRGTGLPDALETWFRGEFAESREITLEAWRARPLHDRFLERFFGVFDPAF